MLQSLRVRLALSHALPILIFVPLLGLTLLYQLERRYFLDNIAEELAIQGILIAELTRTNSQIWTDPQVASAIINQLQERIPARMEFVDSQSNRLASTAVDEQELLGESSAEPLVQKALTGKVAWTIDATTRQGNKAIDVAVPVHSRDGSVAGVVRLSHSLSDLQARINSLRWLVLGTLFAGAAVSLVVGVFLARALGTPLIRLSRTVANFRPYTKPKPEPETGPTEIKSLMSNFNEMSERIHELERTRKLLLSGVVHELGRPLGAIKAAAQTIEHSVDPALTAELATGIDEQVDNMRLQLDDLVLLAEMEHGGIELDRGPTDLGELIHEECCKVAPLAARRDLEFRWNEHCALPIICADARRVTQIMGNLLHNACKYTPQGGRISVSAALEDSNGTAIDTPQRWLLVRVSNSGPGIPPEEQERIFDLFYRSPAQRRIHQGMGIGLALARELAVAHGGTLVVDSAPERGVTFSLRLPVAQLLTCQGSMYQELHHETELIAIEFGDQTDDT